MIRSGWLYLTLVLMVFAPVAGQASDEGVLKTVGKVLQIGVGARGVGVGEAMTAASDDVEALYWNPAGLERVRAPQISYTHNLWIASIQDADIAYAQPFLEGGIGGSINYINYGSFEKFDVSSDGYPIPLNENFSPYALVLTAGCGQKLASFLAAGINLKLISESADTYSGMSIGADFGLQFLGIANGMDLGIMIQNVGLPIAGYRLPMVGKAGFAYQIPLLFNPKNDRLVFAADLNLAIPNDQPMYFNAGLEYSYWNTLALRVGYRQSDNNTNLGQGMVGLTAGVGLHLMDFNLDYAIAPMGELGLTHRISLAYTFETIKKKSPKRSTVGIHNTYPPTATGTVPPAGDNNGDTNGMLISALPKLTMRKPIKVGLDITLDRMNKNLVSKAVFTFEVKNGKVVKHWTLKINSANGNLVWNNSGTTLPENVVWNGQNRAGHPVNEAASCTYELQIRGEDGTEEMVSGNLMEEAVTPVTATTASDNQANQIKLETIYFEESSVDLNESALAVLKSSAEKIQARPYVQIQAEGFADAGAEKEQSFMLSQRRVDSVVRYLTATFKIPLKNISARARGSKNPIAPNTTETGRKQNRRVEMMIIYKQ